jgi:predicted amidohydrolase YtcJ
VSSGHLTLFDHNKATKSAHIGPAAYASFSNITGSLTPGKRFDAVIWDDDLLTVPQEEILEMRAKGTIIDGRLVWGRLDM